jgi:hypothetical protein
MQSLTALRGTRRPALTPVVPGRASALGRIGVTRGQVDALRFWAHVESAAATMKHAMEVAVMITGP